MSKMKNEYKNNNYASVEMKKSEHHKNKLNAYKHV